MSANPYERDRAKTVVRAIDVTGRVPPHSEDAEAAVLSTVLTDSGALDIVLEILPNGEAFYGDAHRRIYDAAVELHAKGRPVDVHTVGNLLNDRERLQAIGGIAYLVTMVSATPTVANVAAYARIVREKFRVRRLIETCQEVTARGYGDYGEGQDFIDDAERRIFEIAAERVDEHETEMRDLVREEVARQRRIQEGVEDAPGVSSGFTDIDELTGGLRDSETTVVGGRPAMGKTALMTAIVRNTAGVQRRVLVDGVQRTETLAALVISIEMKKQQLTRRMIAAEARISAKRYLRGQSSPAEIARAMEAAAVLERLPIAIDDASHWTPTKLRARIRRAAATCRRKGLRLFLVALDYIQRVHPDMRVRGGSREREVAEVMTSFVEAVKDTGTHGLVLAQLSRDVEKRSGKDLRPRISDLRESGQLEQDAQNIIFIHRPEYYIAEKAKVPEALRGRAEAIIAKAREGEGDVVPLAFTGFCTRFDNETRTQQVDWNWHNVEDDT